MRTLSLCLMVLAVTSCSKNAQQTPAPPPPAGYKIMLAQGANQSDTVGNSLKSLLQFQVTKNKDTIGTGYVLIETYDCDSNLQTQQYTVGKNGNSFGDPLHATYCLPLRSTAFFSLPTRDPIGTRLLMDWDIIRVFPRPAP